MCSQLGSIGGFTADFEQRDLARRPGTLATAENMQMQVINSLPTLISGINHIAKTFICETLLFGDRVSSEQEFTDRKSVV